MSSVSVLHLSNFNEPTSVPLISNISNIMSIKRHNSFAQIIPQILELKKASFTSMIPLFIKNKQRHNSRPNPRHSDLQALLETRARSDSQKSISLQNYFIRIVKLAEFDLVTVIYGYVLVSRFFDHLASHCNEESDTIGGENSLNNLCLYKIVACGLFLAQKYLQDVDLWDLENFSTITGLKMSKLKKMEVQFLEVIGFRVYVPMRTLDYTMQTLIQSTYLSL